jgi:hypothetical protein
MKKFYSSGFFRIFVLSASLSLHTGMAFSQTSASASSTPQLVQAAPTAGNNQEKLVDAISGIRNISKLKYSRASAAGYYLPGDGGGGNYYYDAHDNASLDNGGTVLVGSDGARWKLIYDGKLSLKQFGAKGDGSADDADAINRWLLYLGEHAGSGYIPAGVYKSASPITIDVAEYSRLGFQIEGAGSQRSVIDLQAVKHIPAFLVTDSNGAKNGAAFYGVLRNFGIKTNLEGTGVQFGRTDFSDALNSFIIDNIVVNNYSTSENATAIEFNHVLASQINVVANAGGKEAGGTAIRLRQTQFSTIKGAAGSAGIGVQFTGGYNFGNTILNPDIEEVNTCVVNENATSTGNTFIGGQFVCEKNAISSTAGNLRFVNPNFGLKQKVDSPRVGVIIDSPRTGQ